MGVSLGPPEKVALDVSYSLNNTWTPKVCKTMALRAIIMGLGPFFYILLGFR